MRRPKNQRTRRQRLTLAMVMGALVGVVGIVVDPPDSANEWALTVGAVVLGLAFVAGFFMLVNPSREP